jgi:hypothetical protein
MPTIRLVLLPSYSYGAATSRGRGHQRVGTPRLGVWRRVGRGVVYK